MLSAPFGGLAIKSWRVEIEEEPSTIAEDLTGALTTVNAMVAADGAPVSLVASGVLSSAGKSALTLAVSTMNFTVPNDGAPSAGDESREACECAARALVPNAALTWRSSDDEAARSELVLLASDEASPLEVVLEQLYLDQDLHILRQPDGQLLVLGRTP